MTKESIVPHSLPLEIAMALPPKARVTLPEFYQVVFASGRYSWIGLVQSIDGLERQRLDIYLLEVVKQKPQGVALGPTFEKLTSALRSDFRAGLYFFSGEEYTPDSVSNHLQEYCRREDAQLIWEQNIIR